MKFGLILNGPVEDLKFRANKLNPEVPIIIVDENTYDDVELFVVFVFEPFRKKADNFNELRLKKKISPFAIMEFPLHKIRPIVKNSVRSRIVEILKEGTAYGYQIFKKYRARYGEISLRLIYYHLKKGEKDGLFEMTEFEEATGDFSWGGTTKHKYYKLKFLMD